MGGGSRKGVIVLARGQLSKGSAPLTPVSKDHLATSKRVKLDNS